jgi:hypothetical protein
MSEFLQVIGVCILIVIFTVTLVSPIAIYTNNKKYEAYVKVTGNEQNLSKIDFFWYRKTFKFVELNNKGE